MNPWLLALPFFSISLISAPNLALADYVILDPPEKARKLVEGPCIEVFENDSKEVAGATVASSISDHSPTKPASAAKNQRLKKVCFSGLGKSFAKAKAELQREIDSLERTGKSGSEEDSGLVNRFLDAAVERAISFLYSKQIRIEALKNELEQINCAEGFANAILGAQESSAKPAYVSRLDSIDFSSFVQSMDSKVISRALTQTRAYRNIKQDRDKVALVPFRKYDFCADRQQIHAEIEGLAKREQSLSKKKEILDRVLRDPNQMLEYTMTSTCPSVFATIDRIEQRREDVAFAAAPQFVEEPAEEEPEDEPRDEEQKKVDELVSEWMDQDAQEQYQHYKDLGLTFSLGEGVLLNGSPVSRKDFVPTPAEIGVIQRRSDLTDVEKEAEMDKLKDSKFMEMLIATGVSEPDINSAENFMKFHLNFAALRRQEVEQSIEVGIKWGITNRGRIFAYGDSSVHSYASMETDGRIQISDDNLDILLEQGLTVLPEDEM
ncbi:MAG: hypothetical protein AB1540_04115 [Bdellovibrionota bacterium]